MRVSELYESNETAWELIGRGKVRDVYEYRPNEMLIVTSDRLSAFDVVLPTPIPDKGVVLTQIANFWFDKTSPIIANHVIDPEPFSADPAHRHLAGRSIVVHRARALPVEAIVRGYLTGSGRKDYEKTGSVCGIALPAGLVEASRLPEPLFTPSTKGELGTHDENISFATMADLVGRELAERVRDVSLELYRFGAAYALERGIIIADTKFEFGMLDDELILIDEVADPGFVAVLAGRRLPGGQEPAQLRQAVRARLPGDARLGQDGSWTCLARGRGHQDVREVPGGVATPDTGVSGVGGGGRSRPATLPQAALHWEKLYAAGDRPWGDSPSDLAQLAVARLGPVGSAAGGDAVLLASRCRLWLRPGQPLPGGGAARPRRRHRPVAGRGRRRALRADPRPRRGVLRLRRDDLRRPGGAGRRLRRRLRRQCLRALGAHRPPGVRGGSRRPHSSRRPPLPEYPVAARSAALCRRTAGDGGTAQLDPAHVSALLHGRGTDRRLRRGLRGSRPRGAQLRRVPSGRRRATAMPAGSWRAADAEFRRRAEASGSSRGRRRRSWPRRRRPARAGARAAADLSAAPGHRRWPPRRCRARCW